MKHIITAVKNIFRLYKPYLNYGKTFVFLSLLFWLVIIPVAQLVGVYLPSTVINFLETGRPFRDVVFYVILMQLILLFQPVYENIFNMFCKNKMLALIDVRLKADAYKQAIKTDYKYIDDPEYYDNYTWAVSQYSAQAEKAQNLVNRMSSSVITIVSMLSIIAILSPLAVIVTIIGTVIENILHMITNYFDVKKDEDIVPYDRKLGYHHRIFYTSNYAADLKSTRIKKYLLEDYDEASRQKISIIKRYAWRMIPSALSADLTFYIARTFVILNIAYGIFTGDIPTVGSYMTMMLAVESLKNALNEMFYYVKDANRLGMYAKRIRAFFDVKSDIETDVEHKLPVPSGAYAVSFQNVCFSYANALFAIKDFNLHIKPGEKIAIVGENGAGKSTLVKLLLRFYNTTSGRISINGTDIKDYNITELRGKIGVAFQNVNVYAISLAKNMMLYNEATDNQLQKIIDKVGLANVLRKNDADISAEVTKEFNEKGIMLSGGEIQKIGISRLFTGEFGLLLLDEPSSALDPLAEYEMTKLILDSSNLSTTIIVAHRLSTIRGADRIVLVDNGSIKEIGTHDELMGLKGKYYEMFTKQAENYIN
ncbi:MAG: ABC transporter ATP-binding protein [Clostridia bacterium]|nr:ABC transporter ATP-binding protein [Clostridia bacterium]